MPKMDGCTACAQLRQKVETQSIPIIAMTDGVGMLQDKLVVTMGAAAYIPKPLQADELRRVVEDCCRHSGG